MIERNLTAIRYLISLLFMIFLVFWLSRCDFSLIYANAANMRPEYIIGAAAAYLLRYAFYARKFQLMFPTFTNFHFKDFFYLAFAASYCTIMVPASGLLVTIWVLKYREDVTPTYSSFAIIAERGGSQIIALLIVSTSLIFVESSTVVQNNLIAFYSFGAAFLIAVASITHHRKRILPALNRLIGILPGAIPRHVKLDGKSIRQLGAVLWSKKLIQLFLVLTTSQLLADGMKLYFVLAFTGHQLPFLSCFVASTIMGFLLAVPILPGSIGAYEVVSISVLHYMFGAPIEIIMIITVIDRVLSTSLIWILGTISLARLNLNKQIALDAIHSQSM